MPLDTSTDGVPSGPPSPAFLVVVGLDHTTAPIELRERLAFAAADIPAALRELAGEPDGSLLEQAAIVSTCNRVEIYGVARTRVGREDIGRFLALRRGVDRRSVTRALYAHCDDEVAHHIAAVTAGLHSLVLGEAQIQGQMRRALDLAVAAGTAGPELRRLFEAAISAGRRVRARTALGRGVASVPQAGVELVRQRLGTLEGATVLLLGAGTVGELAAKHLRARGGRELIVIGRDAARAERLAERHGGRTLPAVRLTDGLALADVVVSSTGSPQPVLRREHIEAALTRRAGGGAERMLLLDLALPRDVDDGVRGLPGVELYRIDDLEQVVVQTIARRSADLPAAYAILRREVAHFTAWLAGRRASAALGSLGAMAEAERAEELARTLAQLPALSRRDRELLDAMTQRLVQKLLHGPGRCRQAVAGEPSQPTHAVTESPTLAPS